MKDSSKSLSSRRKNKIDEEENEGISAINEFEIHSNRIRRILNETIDKLRMLAHLPMLIENDGEILRQHLQASEVDFILDSCKVISNLGIKDPLEEDSNYSHITNVLDKISMFDKTKSVLSTDNFDAHTSYAVNIILNSKSLVELLDCCYIELEPSVAHFMDLMDKLKTIVEDKLSSSGTEELQRENDIRMSYRTHITLMENIRELEDQLNKQRAELGKEHDRKTNIMIGLSEKIGRLKEQFKQDINQVVYQSEKAMMEQCNISEERQAELVIESKQVTQLFESLLEEHLESEKAMRAKRFKVETQLASWLTKYDTDIGEKQAEFEELQETFDKEREEMDILQEKFFEQEEEYLVLMKEKEEEERRIYEEKAFQFLMNRSARRIQRCWRQYRERKLARKRARKSKKKGGSADKKGGKKAPPKDKNKKKEETTTLRGGPDPNALLEGKFDKELLEDIKQEDAFAKKDVVVDLSAD